MSRPLQIGVDVDDVLFPWFQRAHEACQRAGITNGQVPSQWECWKDYGCEMQQWLDALEVATLDGSLYLGEPYPGAVEALQDLLDAGHQIHLVTARGFFVHGDLIRRHTVEWLAEHQVPHQSLMFSKQKSLARVDVFADDSCRNVCELEAAGVAAFMIDAPHNQSVDRHRRIADIRAFADLILEGS